MRMTPEPRDLRRAALIVSVIAAFLTAFMSSAINVALPALGREFTLDAVSLGWIPSAYLLAASIFLLPLGRLADIVGRKRVFTVGVSLYALGSLACGLSPSAAWLIALRIPQGIGGAMMLAPMIAILTSVYPAGERGRAIGVNVASTYLGLSLGPVLGGLITQRLGWRVLFLVNVPVAAAALALTLWKLRGEWAEAQGERFDVSGALLFGVSLAATMYGFTRLPDAWGVWSGAAGVGGLVLFVLRQSRTASPLLDLGLFSKNRVFALSNLAALINYSATYAVAFLLSLYLQYIKVLTPEQSGLVLVSQPVFMALLSPAAGRLSDRLEPRIIASAGMILVAAGLCLLAFVGTATTLIYVVAGLAVLGTGFGLFSSPNTHAVMAAVDKRFYGLASATLGTMRSVGMVFSMGTAMLVFALRIGRVAITPEVATSFVASLKILFLLFAALCLAGVFASIVRGSARQPSAVQPEGGAESDGA
jgi:EmrB/QacA subfamily drug resistance transporter